METESYKTKDLWEAGALLTQSIQLLDIERNGSICYFIFGNAEQARNKAHDYYYGKLSVDAYSYQIAISRLKKQIFKR